MIRFLLMRDVRIVGRDSFLLPLMGYPLLIAFGGRFVIERLFGDRIELFAAPAICAFGPLVIGSVFGFALLEEKEQGTGVLMKIVPVAPWRVTLYTVGMTSFVAGLVATGCVVLYGRPVIDGWRMSWGIGMASLTAPLVALLLRGLATNKIEGLGVGKGISSLSLIGLTVFFLPVGGQLLFAWSPWYWLYQGLLGCFVSEEVLAAEIPYWPGVSRDFSLFFASFLILGGLAVFLKTDLGLRRHRQGRGG